VWFAQSHRRFALAVLVPICVVARRRACISWLAGHEGIHGCSIRTNGRARCSARRVCGDLVPALGYGVAHWNHHRYTNQASDPDAAIYPQFRTFWRRFFFAARRGTRSHMRNLLLMRRTSARSATAAVHAEEQRAAGSIGVPRVLVRATVRRVPRAMERCSRSDCRSSP
jgi:fatty acid desaturase